MIMSVLRFISLTIIKEIFILCLIVPAFSFAGSENIGKSFPNEELKTLNGDTFDMASITKPAIVSFWSTTCIPCIKELNAINDKYDFWKKEYKIEVYAISTDDARFSSRVPLIVEKKRWKFPIYTDQEKKMFKALNIVNNPYTIIINKAGKIVYEHTSYKEGDEDELIKIIKGL